MTEEVISAVVYKPTAISAEETDSPEECRILVQAQHDEHIYEPLDGIESELTKQFFGSLNCTPHC